MRKLVQCCLRRTEWVCALTLALAITLLYAALEWLLDSVLEPLDDRVFNWFNRVDADLTKKDVEA